MECQTNRGRTSPLLTEGSCETPVKYPGILEDVFSSGTLGGGLDGVDLKFKLEFACRVCQAQFSDTILLANHLKEMHMRGRGSTSADHQLSKLSEATEEHSITEETPTALHPVNTVQPPQKRKKRKLIVPLSLRPRSQKRIPVAEEPLPRLPTHCILCNTGYQTYTAWHVHAVEDHVKKDNPKPQVEMNYVDVHTLNKDQSQEGSIITTAKVNGTPGRGSIQEQLKLTVCRDKGRYVVKKPSFYGEFHDATMSSAPTSTVFSDDHDGIHAALKTAGFSSGGSKAEVGGVENHIPPISSLGSSTETGSSSTEINMLADKENSLPQVVGQITTVEIPESILVSKVATSPFGTSVSDPDRTLVTGNSHMVNIQNDILHVGANTDEDSIQRIASTNNNVPQFHNRKMMEAMKGVLTEELKISVDKESLKDAAVVSVLNMSPFSRPMPEDVTAMVSEEIQSSKDLEENHRNTHRTAEERRDPAHDEDSSDSMQLRIAVGENGPGSQLDPQESLQEDSPKELLPHEAAPDSCSEIRNGFEVPKSTAPMSMPFHITLPSGIEIEQLPIRRESVESTQSEDIDVDDSGLGDSRTSELNIDEETTRDHERVEPESDDFRCKVCNALFTSDDDLETHFSEAHFRGIANNILEPPESPFMSTGSGQDHMPMPPPAHASSNGSIYRTASNESIPRNFSMPAQAHQLPQGSQSERRTSDSDKATEYLPPNGSYMTSQFYMRGDGGNVHALQMRPPQSMPLPGGGTLVPNRSVSQAPVSQGNLKGIFGDPLSVRPELQGDLTTSYTSSLIRSSSQSTNLQMQLNRNPPPLSASRSTMIHRPYPYIPQQQNQTQPTSRETTPKTYPNALHNALNSVVQLGSQRQLSLVRHDSQERDGGGSLSLGLPLSRTVQQQLPTPPTSSAHRSHLLAMVHHQRQQQQYQLLQQQNLRARQEQQQRQSQHPTVADIRQQAALLEQQRQQIRSHQYPQNVLGKRPSPQDMMASLPKQPRIDPPSRIPVTSEYSAREVSNSSQLASALGSGGVRLGNSITLSVCSGDEGRTEDQRNPNYPLLRGSISTGQSQRSPLSAIGSNPNSMTNALAVRGVTVSPASPTHPDHMGHRLQPQISTSPSQSHRSSPGDIPNSVSVIQNGGLSNTPSPPSHQFAIPHMPGPRVDRPERPPTVDLTTDEMNAYAAQQSRYMEQWKNRSQGQSSQNAQQRLPSSTRPAPAVACNLCGVLFSTPANLEEHKIHRHGLRPPSGPSSSTGVGREPNQGHPSPPLRTQQPQSVRASSNFRSPPSNPSGSSRSLFIPLLDITRMDPTKLKRLEELGVHSMIPLQGNDRTLGQMGIPLLLPTINLRDGNAQLPWDHLQPIGPVFAPSQMVQPGGPHRSSAPPNSSNH